MLLLAVVLLALELLQIQLQVRLSVAILILAVQAIAHNCIYVNILYCAIRECGPSHMRGIAAVARELGAQLLESCFLLGKREVEDRKLVFLSQGGHRLVLRNEERLEHNLRDVERSAEGSAACVDAGEIPAPKMKAALKNGFLLMRVVTKL